MQQSTQKKSIDQKPKENTNIILIRMNILRPHTRHIEYIDLVSLGSLVPPLMVLLPSSPTPPPPLSSSHLFVLCRCRLFFVVECHSIRFAYLLFSAFCFDSSFFLASTVQYSVVGWISFSCLIYSIFLGAQYFCKRAETLTVLALGFRSHWISICVLACSPILSLSVAPFGALVKCAVEM